MKYSYSNRNIGSKSYSGFRGIAWNKEVKNWQVTIKYSDKNKYIGRFKNIEDAITVRKNVEQACDLFKYLEIKSFQIIRDKNNKYYLFTLIQNRKLPLYLEVGVRG